MEPAPHSTVPLTFFRTPPAGGTGLEALPGRRADAGAAPNRKRHPFTRRPAGQTRLLRHSLQGAFLLLNLWVGARFYFFVRFHEIGGAGLFVPRPPGVEGWLPIAGLMNLELLLLTGSVPEIHPAGLFLLLAFIGIAFAFRKAFCSWLCPVGTLSEWLWQGGQAMFGRTFALPRWLDVPLRGLKYLLLAFFVWAIARMSAAELLAFQQSPYGLMADVKMLNFFRDLGLVGAAVIAGLAVLSVVVQNAWCRYLCPYGALLGIAALFSPARIRRDPGLCIDCAKCAKACPSRLPVDTLLSVRSMECTGCLDCVAVCPARGALDLRVGRRRVLSPATVAIGILAIFLGLVGYARFSGHWHTNLPEQLYFDLIPQASSLSHPYN